MNRKGALKIYKNLKHRFDKQGQLKNKSTNINRRKEKFHKEKSHSKNHKTVQALIQITIKIIT